MSLINQMLRDLDRRRGAAAPGEVPPAYTALARRRRAWLPALVIGAILLLAAFTGWLAWERYAAPPPAVAAAPAAPAVATTATAPPQPATPPPAGATPPASAAATPPAPSPRETEPPPSRPVAPVRAQDSPPPARAAAPEPPPAAEADGPGSVRKSARPVTPMQRAEEHYRRAYTLLSRGQAEMGEAALRRALEADPGHDKARELLALVLIRGGRYVEAGELLREGLRLHPGNRQQVRILAQVLAHQQRLDEAVRLLESHRPVEVTRDPDYYALLAAYYRQQGRHAEAAATYRRLVAARPDNGLWWIGLGLSLEALGRPEAAREAFRRARDTGALTAPLRRFVQERLDKGAPEE